MCMRNDTVGSSAHNGVLLKDLEDKLEMARVQKLILDSLTSLRTTANVAINDAIKELNSTLFDMSQMYNKFAERFDLWECKLTILNCAHYNDPLLIESVWTNILDRELKGPGSKEDIASRMILKVKHLSREHGSGQCFPLSKFL